MKLFKRKETDSMAKQKTVNVQVSRDQVITLGELAKKYGEWYGVKAKANPNANTIDFITEDGEAAYVDESGFAYTRIDDRTLDEYECNWCENLDVSDLVWATDADGQLVALIN